MVLSRTDWKYIVDMLMFLCMLGIVLIGLLMGFVIPEGRLGLGESKYFLGVHRQQWGDIHLHLSLAFTAFVVVHVALAWSWLKGKAKSIFGKAWKVAVGLTVVAAALVPLIFWIAASKNDPAYSEFGGGLGRQEGRVAEVSAGVAAEAVVLRGETVAGADIDGDKSVVGRTEAGSAGAVITGKMTLREVERATGVPAEDIVARLGLPADVSLDETLGRLRRQHGFAIAEARDAVMALLNERK